MKSYIQGLITGGVFVFAFIVILGNQKAPKNKGLKTYRAKIIEIEDRIGMVESILNERFKMVGENFLYLKNNTGVSSISEYNLNSMTLIQNPYSFDNLLGKEK